LNLKDFSLCKIRYLGKSHRLSGFKCSWLHI